MFPYSVGGIIILGLMVSSIRKFALELSRDNIIKTHAEKRRVKTINRSVTTTEELEQRQAVANRRSAYTSSASGKAQRGPRGVPVRSGMELLRRVGTRNQKLLLLEEEKDRFDAMRRIQKSTSNFKRYTALTMSVTACKLPDLALAPTFFCKGLPLLYNIIETDMPCTAAPTHMYNICLAVDETRQEII